MDSSPDHRPASASDHLMVQINVDNVMQVYRLFDDRVAQLQDGFKLAAQLRDIPACADDPISRDARELFQPKVNAIVDAHAAHAEEVIRARDRLREAAEQYGLLEDEAASAFTPRSLPPSHPSRLDR